MPTPIERLTAAGPKRILACDGGGIRGLMSVEILAKLERDLRAARNQPDLVLADVFDFVCGTSTGAIIATCLSAGMSTDAIRGFYVENGRQMFDRASYLERLRAKGGYVYRDEPLAQTLKIKLNEALGASAKESPAMLGDQRLRTLLMMVLRNHSTDSPWPVSNNPRARYNQRVRDDGTPRMDCNLDLPLWQLVRASTAAPTYFPPEVVTLAEGTEREYTFVFVDGGVTTYNNPAFLAFQMATAAPYHVNWPTGADQLLIVSVGTGNAPSLLQGSGADLSLLHFAQNVPNALMNAATAGWDMTCRLLGECRFGPPIDREFGALLSLPGGPPTFSGPKLFTYVRYDPPVTTQGLEAIGLPHVNPANVSQLDSVAYIDDLRRVGEAYAARHVTLDHFGPLA